MDGGISLMMLTIAANTIYACVRLIDVQNQIAMGDAMVHLKLQHCFKVKLCRSNQHTSHYQSDFL